MVNPEKSDKHKHAAQFSQIRKKNKKMKQNPNHNHSAITDEDFKMLSESFMKFKKNQIETLVFIDCKFTNNRSQDENNKASKKNKNKKEKTIDSLIELMLNNPSIHSFTANNCDLTDKDCNQIAKFWSKNIKNVNLRRIVLRNNALLTAQTFKTFSNIITKFPPNIRNECKIMFDHRDKN